METEKKPDGYVKFTVIGEPQGKARPQFTTKNGRTRAITPKKTAIYERVVRLEYRRQCGAMRFSDNAMIGVRIEAYYSIPKSKSRKVRSEMLDESLRPTKKPDVDNIAKAVLDALNGVAYADDKSIVDCKISKFYSDRPRVEVELWGIS